MIDGEVARFFAHVERCTQREAISAEGTRISYRTLFQLAAMVEERCRAQGVRADDRVLLDLENGLPHAAAYLSGLVGGYAVVPLNQALPERDKQYIRELIRPRLTVDAALLADLRPSDAMPTWRARDEATFLIAVTSGTTSRPKAVCHSFGAMLGNAAAFNALVGTDDSQRMLHVMPMGYVAGFLNTLLCPLSAGGAVVVAPRFEAQSAMHFWKPAMNGRANSAWLTPTMVAMVTRLANNADTIAWVRANIEHVFVGTAPLHEPVREAFEKQFGVPCLQSYGMAELLLVSSNLPSDPSPRGTVGKLIDRIATRFVCDDGVEIAGAAGGNLQVSTPFVTQGYLDVKTGEPAPPPPWFDTGDRGRLEANGHLAIMGRTKDLIIRGGTNISPVAVEDVLLGLDGIEEVAVVGIPHPFWGEQVAAVIVLTPGKQFDEAAAKKHCRQNLPRDAVPERFVVLDALPKSSTGKIQKHLIREMM